MQVPIRSPASLYPLTSEWSSVVLIWVVSPKYAKPHVRALVSIAKVSCAVAFGEQAEQADLKQLYKSRVGGAGLGLYIYPVSTFLF